MPHPQQPQRRRRILLLAFVTVFQTTNVAGRYAFLPRQSRRNTAVPFLSVAGDKKPLLLLREPLSRVMSSLERLRGGSSIEDDLDEDVFEIGFSGENNEVSVEAHEGEAVEVIEQLEEEPVGSNDQEELKKESDFSLQQLLGASDLDHAIEELGDSDLDRAVEELLSMDHDEDNFSVAEEEEEVEMIEAEEIVEVPDTPAVVEIEEATDVSTGLETTEERVVEEPTKDEDDVEDNAEEESDSEEENNELQMESTLESQGGVNVDEVESIEEESEADESEEEEEEEPEQAAPELDEDDSEEEMEDEEEEVQDTEEKVISTTPVPITIRTATGNSVLDQSIELTVVRSRNVASLKKSLNRQLPSRPPVAAMRLTANGSLLDDEALLDELIDDEDEDDDDDDDEHASRLVIQLDMVPPVDPKFVSQLAHRMPDLTMSELLDAYAANEAACHYNAELLAEDDDSNEEEDKDLVEETPKIMKRFVSVQLREQAARIRRDLEQTLLASDQSRKLLQDDEPPSAKALLPSKTQVRGDRIRHGAGAGGVRTTLKRKIQKNLNIQWASTLRHFCLFLFFGYFGGRTPVSRALLLLGAPAVFVLQARPVKFAVKQFIYALLHDPPGILLSLLPAPQQVLLSLDYDKAMRELYGETIISDTMADDENEDESEDFVEDEDESEDFDEDEDGSEDFDEDEDGSEDFDEDDY